MTLVESEIIKNNPIGGGLDGFRRLFRSTCADLGISESPGAAEKIVLLAASPGGAASSDAARYLVFKLIVTLQDLSATRLFPSPNGLGTLSGYLSRFYSTVDLGNFDSRSIVPLLIKVLNKAPDADIWDAVNNLVIESTPPHTPSSTILSSSITDTPLKSTSGSQQGSEQIHKKLDERILQEISGCVYNDTKGFYEKYFEGKSWSSTAEQIIQRVNPQTTNGLWTGYPNPPSQSAFFKWFWKLQSTYLSGGRSMYYTSHNRSLAGSSCDRQPDLFVAPSGTITKGGKYNWMDVRVIGELKESVSKNYPDELAKFCGHAREVFTSQPTRLFLHGFIIRGSMVELWVIDRSGPYSCKQFDLHENPDRFIKVIAGYTMMSDEELGLNTYIKEDGHGKYIMFKAESKIKEKEEKEEKEEKKEKEEKEEKKEKEEEERLYLEDKPIAFQHAIVCRGTTCYRAKRLGAENWEFVIKFSWRSDKRRAEGELLRLAKEREVWGVARLFGYQDLDSIANLRQGLQFGEPRKSSPAISGSISQTQSRTKSVGSKKSLSRSASLAISREVTPGSSSSGQKRKQEQCDDVTELRRSKRSKSGSSRRREDITDLVTAEQSSSTESSNKYSVEKPGTTSLIPPRDVDDESYDNRICCCLVVSPPGRAIHEFKSVLEFLKVFRDVIKAHRSLYRDGKILHRDISKNNIIITTDAKKKEEDPSGMLIDLDLAKELGSGPSGARHRTGTMEFMAIEVLECGTHTYRHDLESLFYVFLWVIIRHGHMTNTSSTKPETSRLQNWYSGTYHTIARIKESDMSKRRFSDLLYEFPPKFDIVKGLAEELRQALFPIREESLFTGTYRDPDKLYKPMIDAFDRMIAKM
ncbi:hypothetical protein GP486_002529 [Trichoglossum hirsutum]|uniref:EKC/KEOPS complex subunit BUD32 n=1 Tax=Trichoglossum hirsutum TaxID=265104 RepID=A0A9P8RRM5_9PEZI|nr:hypothetical protein GP486_002529 [Trichoglossum hirsutum]